MAHEAAKLDHTIPLARAEPNRVGPGWAISVPRAEAADTLLHIHPDESQTGKLWDIAPKVGEPPLPPKPRPPEPPTNEELRAQLIAALERKAEAEAQLHGATEAHNRAVQLRDERRRRLLTFDQL